MIFFKVSSKFGVGSYLEFNGNKDCRSMSEGSLGSGPKGEYRSCIRVSTADKSRFQNLSRICQVDEDKEFAASG